MNSCLISQQTIKYFYVNINKKLPRVIPQCHQLLISVLQNLKLSQQYGFSNFRLYSFCANIESKL